MSTDDIEFFKARELEERDAANAASDDAVRNIHLAMAERYASIMTGQMVSASADSRG